VKSKADSIPLKVKVPGLTEEGKEAEQMRAAAARITQAHFLAGLHK